MATWIVGGVVAAGIAAIAVKLIRDKKAGKSSCGGDCSCCHGACRH